MGYQQKKYKKFVATAATATLVASAIVPVASAKSFSDVAENNEFQPFINALSDSKIINGYADGTFKPGAKLTRGQVVKMLGRWVESNGTAIPTDWNSKQRFNDVPVNSADQELVKYAALVKDAGVFNGSNGNLMAGNNITRQQMAKVLNGAYEAVKGVSLVELAKGVDDVLIQDLGKSYQEFEGHIQALVDLKISTVSVFRPTENVTRAQFAKFLYNTINLNAETVGEVTYKVAAVNATTVEVTFPSDIKNIKDLDFKIEGLEVKNAVVKQTAANVAVLTTATQQADKEYTVTVDGEKVGSFKGIGAVIPTEIKVEQASYQAKVGQQVTLKAKTTPGAAVTFNVQATGNSLNENKKHEVYAGTDGVATYTYTQYGVAGVDKVTVYPTGAPNLLDYAQVYWGKDTILAVDAEEKTVDNGGNRTYTVTYKDPTTGQPVSGKTLNVTFKENVNDIDGSKTNDTTASIRKTIGQNAGQYVTPYQDTTATAGSNREEAFQVTTNSEGKATFVVTGKNTTATPIVFEDADKNSRYAATELQATAGAAKFQGVQSPYTITWDRTTDFVAAMSQEHNGQQNPIAYKLKVVTDKKNDKGEAIPYAGATIKVAIQQNIDAPLNNNTPAQIATTENGSYTTNGVVSVVTDSKGEATVYLKSAVDNTKATPVAWIDLNTAGNNATVGDGRLEEGEPNAVAPTVTFLKSVVVAPGYSLNTPTAGSYVTGDRMTWKASLENQSGKVSETAGVKNATYTVTNTSNKILTINPRLVDAAGTNYNKLTITYSGQTQTQPFTNGSQVKLEPGTTVTIHGNAPGLRNEYAQTTITQNGTTITTTANQSEYSTTNDALLHVVAPNLDGSLSVSANVTTVRKSVTQDSRNNNNTYTYEAKVANFIKAVTVANAFGVDANGNPLYPGYPADSIKGTVTGEVIGYDIVDTTAKKADANQPKANKFDRDEKVGEVGNYGRVVIKERHTGEIKVFYYNDKDTFSAALDGNFNAQTDNQLGGATPFEKLLTIGDQIQVNNTNSPSNQVGTVRLFNKDASTNGTAEGNGTVTKAISAKTVDVKGNNNQGDGTIERIRVTFNAPVTSEQLKKLERVYTTQVLSGVTVNNTEVALANPTLVNPTLVDKDKNISISTEVEFEIVSKNGNAIKSGTDYLAGSTLFFNKDAAEKLNIGNSSVSVQVADGAAPVVLGAVPTDNDGKNGYDAVKFTFSEPIKNAIDLADFRFSLDSDRSKYVNGKTSKFSSDYKELTVTFDNLESNKEGNPSTLWVNYAQLNSATNNLGIVDLAGNNVDFYQKTLPIASSGGEEVTGVKVSDLVNVNDSSVVVGVTSSGPYSVYVKISELQAKFPNAKVTETSTVTFTYGNETVTGKYIGNNEFEFYVSKATKTAEVAEGIVTVK